MGSLECMFVGEQAKKLRESAGLSYEDVTTVSKLTVVDLQNFENGELYSTEVIQYIYYFYFQAIELVYTKQEKSFLNFLDKFSSDNDLDNESLTSTYFETIANVVINNPDKKMSINTLKDIMINSSTYLDLYQEANTNIKSLANKITEVVEIADKTHAAYADARDAWRRNRDMTEILIDIVITNGLEDIIIEKVTGEMAEWRELGDFPEHDEESYKELIHQLKHKWDFIHEAEIVNDNP